MECEFRLADMRGPFIPPFTIHALNQSAMGPLPGVWQHDAVLALSKFAKTGPTHHAWAGQALAEELWRLLYKAHQTSGAGLPARPQGPDQPSSGARLVGGPIRACFRCGLHCHWARDCTEPISGFGRAIPA